MDEHIHYGIEQYLSSCSSPIVMEEREQHVQLCFIGEQQTMGRRRFANMIITIMATYQSFHIV